MTRPMMIPSIDIAALFDPAASLAREAADRAIAAAASESGFMLVTGLAAHIPIAPAQLQKLKRAFALTEQQRRPLLRQKFRPENQNIYRGWFPLQNGFETYKEGIDMGPDVAYGDAVIDNTDPLREATPLPPESDLPGWRADAGAYYRGMEQVGGVLMRAIARGLGLDDGIFDAAFKGGISTFRLIRYPVRSDASYGNLQRDRLTVTHDGRTGYFLGTPHVDSGFVTLLAQDGVEGLQARHRDGGWIDVPPTDNSLVVNFGKLLERWTGGRIKATEHRVIGWGQERYSIPFFYEPRVDAVISPLPLADMQAFTPFLYGDYLWQSTTKFVEFAGLEHRRPPRGLSAAQ
ncbi:isopenicillin N synthase family dioxygenase [Dongia soli]|uniref:2-oxoglutarate-dependent ethylene/succinate-forming enzyme n=1 Tax=Dongia soli TaxID=600628 RepID=A0ABU5EED3_9PROT|nr:2OG-Fe(II) oxygenase family protein [Dongia soli]MDY0884576.1 2OG-Fe(II) oxygenase family protein [Dongia soli]